MKMINRISTCIFISIIYFVPAFIFSFAFFGALKEFEMLDFENQLNLSVAVAIIFSVITLVVKIIRVKRKQSSKIEIWVSFNYAKIFLSYIVLVLIFYSLKSHLVFNIDEIKEILDVQWGMFGISITIFLVWSVFITEYLKKNIPNKAQKLNLMEELKYIDAKSDFYADATRRFMTVSVLSINLIVLLFATTATYLLAYYDLSDITLIAQNFTIVSFYLCTNTLVGLFFDILAPLAKERKDILSKCKPTKEEINVYVQRNKEISTVIKDANLLYGMKSIDDKQKISLASDILSRIIEQPFSLEINDESEAFDENHSEIKFKIIYGEKSKRNED